MTDQLDNALKRLVKEVRADAALVWSRVGRAGGAIVLNSYPVPVPTGPMPCEVPDGAGSGALERDAERMTSLLPEAIGKALPTTPAAARSFPLGVDLAVTLVWCDPTAPTELAGERHRQALADLGAVAQLSRDLHFAEGDVERLRAAVDGLPDGVVIVNPATGAAAVNGTAAGLLDLAQGSNPAAAFEQALSGLAARVLNPAEVDSCVAVLDTEPMASISCMWRFPNEPTHLLVVSKPLQHANFQGRTWIFYNESRSAQALESLEHAHAQLRASADGMLDPQALLQAVRDDRGQIVDFVYRDVNRATCTYLSKTRDDLIGHTVVETMPQIVRSGLLPLYIRCITTHEPMILDDVPYNNEILSGVRRYDIRGNHVGGDFLTITWRDVTERFAAAQRIAQSEERFRLLAENAGDVVMHIRDGVIVWVSPSVQDALGAPPDHWVGRELRDIIPESDRDATEKVTWLTPDRAVIPRGRVVAIDGTTHWVHVHARTFYGPDGKPDGYTSSFRIIDDEVRAVDDAEDARRCQAQSDERYRRLMDNSAVPMCVANSDGRFEVVNEAACRYFGYDAEDLCTMTWRDFIVPETRESDMTEYAQFLAGDIDTYRGVKQHIRSDGQRVWGDLSVSCLRNSDGELESFITQIIDITDQVEAQQVIEQARREQAYSDARYRRLMDNSAVGMAMVTPAGRFEIVNQALCDFFGHDAETLKTMTWQELTAADSLEDDLLRIDDVLAGRIDRYRLTKQYIHADGHLIWGDLSVSCLRDHQGEVEYFVAQIIDITTEVAIRRQVAQRDQQNRALAQRLQAQTDRLRSEIKIAAAYVTSLLPGDIEGPVQVSYRYLPSRELGGDCFDYRWIDNEHLMVYLIDVSGHGIAPALESISVHNLLRSGALPIATLLEPAVVLAELNSKFPMDDHGGNYFTMWYGIYQATDRTLRYATAGHPPALAYESPGTDPVRLASRGVPVGMFADTVFACETYRVPPGAEIIVYSDGAFELPLPTGATWSLKDFVALCTALSGSDDWTVDELAEKLKARTVAGLFNDDCSLLRLRFD